MSDEEGPNIDFFAKEEQQTRKKLVEKDELIFQTRKELKNLERGSRFFGILQQLLESLEEERVLLRTVLNILLAEEYFCESVYSFEDIDAYIKKVPEKLNLDFKMHFFLAEEDFDQHLPKDCRSRVELNKFWLELQQQKEEFSYLGGFSDSIKSFLKLEDSSDESCMICLLLNPEKMQEIVGLAVFTHADPDFYSEKTRSKLALPTMMRSFANLLFMLKRKKEALKDELTGLGTRKFLYESADRIISEIKRGKKRNLFAAVLDLDGFKQINDEKGHLAGDEVLKKVAGILTSVVRAGDEMVRLGGDEFAILFDAEDEEGAQVFCGRVQEAISKEIGCSIGWKQFDKDVHLPKGELKEIDVLLQAADKEMYENKKERKK